MTPHPHTAGFQPCRANQPHTGSPSKKSSRKLGAEGRCAACSTGRTTGCAGWWHGWASVPTRHVAVLQARSAHAWLGHGGCGHTEHAHCSCHYSPNSTVQHRHSNHVELGDDLQALSGSAGFPQPGHLPTCLLGRAVCWDHGEDGAHSHWQEKIWESRILCVPHSLEALTGPAAGIVSSWGSWNKVCPAFR